MRWLWIYPIIGSGVVFYYRKYLLVKMELSGEEKILQGTIFFILLMLFPLVIFSKHNIKFVWLWRKLIYPVQVSKKKKWDKLNEEVWKKTYGKP